MSWVDPVFSCQPNPIAMNSLKPILENCLIIDGPSALAQINHAAQTEADDRQLKLLRDCTPGFRKLQTALKLPDACWDTLWRIWIPLASSLLDWQIQQPDNQPLIVGFLGGQGTGKTTLTRVLTCILESQGKASVGLSLDDLYLTYAERLNLLDRRLDRRGPPGTHDIPLGLQTLKALKAATCPVELPWFDKSLHHGQGDRGPSKTIDPVDFVLFEGWFVGARSIAPFTFEGELPEPIVSHSDRDFARDMNLRLYDYQPLWDLLDRLVILHVPDYRLSKVWRKQAEHELIDQGKSGMSDDEIDRFVEYFWKALHPELFIEPLVKEPGWTDWVMEIGPDHQPKGLTRPVQG
jgi:D-glycerate 3-kinase